MEKWDMIMFTSCAEGTRATEYGLTFPTSKKGRAEAVFIWSLPIGRIITGGSFKATRPGCRIKRFIGAQKPCWPQQSSTARRATLSRIRNKNSTGQTTMIRTLKHWFRSLRIIYWRRFPNLRECITIFREDSLKMEMADRLRIICSQNSLSPEERERRKQGAQRLKGHLSSSPFHQRGAALEPGGENAYWERLYESCVNL